LGEALVSGQITPDSYVIDRSDLSIIKESIGYQRVMLKIIKDKPKPFYEDVPFHKRNARKLTLNQVKNIAQVCLSVEKKLDFNIADIEWTFEADILYILQARPYAAISNGS
jgi:pyruvate,water dikinase